MTGDMVLDYPNKEVRESMFRFLLSGLSNPIGFTSSENSVKAMLSALESYDLDTVRTIINALLAGLPYETYQNKSEGLYHGLIHLIFKLMGIFVKSEVHSAFGRADSVVETESDVFIFEFMIKDDEVLNFVVFG